MTIYTEYELRCDCRGDEDRYGCEPAIYGATKAQATRDALDAGWTVHALHGGVVRHFRPGHEPTGGAR